MYADIHCYPVKIDFNSHEIDSQELKDVDESRSRTISSFLKGPKSKSHQTHTSQCDLEKSVKARVKLMFAALYPLEKGFLHGSENTKVNRQTLLRYFDKVNEQGEPVALEWLRQELSSIPGVGTIKPHDLDFLRNRFKKFPIEKIRSLQNEPYDYFAELIREYKFYLTKAGQATDKLGNIKSGVYHLAQNGTDVLYRLRPDNNDIIIVFTLEGIHSLGVGNPKDEQLKQNGFSDDISIGKLKSRIRQLKGEEPLEGETEMRWTHCPFFITFSHHFNNTLCGHARSLPRLSKYLFDQSQNMDKGILKNSAYEVLLELLGLNENLGMNGSKRILIDVNHMSAASRQDYYKKIIRPFNRKPEDDLAKIPIIASQAAYSGVDNLDTLILNAKQGIETDDSFINGFKSWNINLCDEDVLEIHDSGGLIGITLEQNLLGTTANSWLPSIPIASLERKRAKNLLARTLEQFIRIPFDYNHDNPMRIWDILCIGTGFDGANSQLNNYSTVLDLNKLEDDITEILTRIQWQRPKWFGNNSPETLARKICFENAYNFVVAHYR